MVGHKAISEDSHAVVPGILGEQAQVKAIVFGAEENLLSIITPLGDMVGKARDYNARYAGHTRKCDPRRIPRKGNEATVPRSPGCGVFPSMRHWQFIALALNLAHAKDVCELATTIRPGAGPVTVHADGLLQVGVVLVLTTSTKEGPRCGVWVEGRNPPPEVDKAFVENIPEKGLNTRFVVSVVGKLYRADKFSRESAPPYLGNGFGRYGTYEYRLVVTKWIRVRHIP